MDNLEANIMEKSMRSVFVGNIPYDVSEDQLKDIFGEVGPVLSFKMVYDRDSGKPKGYGFCEYRDQETALCAMRNLNGYEICGRVLRVDNACTEKSRMEMQNLLNQPPPDNPYGEPTTAEKAPDAITKVVATLPPERMLDVLKQMKEAVQNRSTETRKMLLQNPQLTYALLQMLVVMEVIETDTAKSMLHPVNQVPATLMPGEKNVSVQIPINKKFLPGRKSRQETIPSKPTEDIRVSKPRRQDVDARPVPGPSKPAETVPRDSRPQPYPPTRPDPRQNRTTTAPARQWSPVAQSPAISPSIASVTASVGVAGASDQEKAALIMQVLQLSDEQIAMLPPQQRTSILALREQIVKTTQRP